MINPTPIRSLRAIVCTVVILFAAVSIHAQTSIQASLTGTVIDPSGAVVAKARVTARAVSTGEQVEALSGDAGTYTFPRLAPGRYTLTFEKEGFQRLVRVWVRPSSARWRAR